MTRNWIGGLICIAIFLSNPRFGRDLRHGPAPNPPPGPDRFTIITVDYTAFEWAMATWKGQQIVCTVSIDHSGPPLPADVYRDCGENIFDEWITQQPCVAQQQSSCAGYYTFFLRSHRKQKELGMQLAPATASVSLQGCEAVPSTATSICEAAPRLIINGLEPLPNETITRIAGTYDGQPFECDQASTCEIALAPTAADGVRVEFWAYSSYGDSSLTFNARVRVQRADTGDPDQIYYDVDVLSSQWVGSVQASCADTWESFPPVGGPPRWLTTPKDSADLASDIPYTYLATNLILNGAVDASSCPQGGLDSSGSVNQCGLDAARPAVVDWQNRFDDLIFNAATQTGVPAHLLKNLFARESQFWPGAPTSSTDAGLGQLTENGADTTLFWNPSFYDQFCPLALPESECSNGYAHLGSEQRDQLRLALVASVNASCANCPLQLDLAQADFSIGVFAHTLLANCEQSGQVIRNASGRAPGEIAAYEDLWKFTLVNYNAGPGCLADAISRTLARSLDLTWDNLSTSLDGACSGAVQYVNDISK